jgi:hypothetical protein
MRLNVNEIAGNGTTQPARFSTGDSVTITLYNMFTGAVIPVDTDVCDEIGTTGVFIFKTSNITALITDFTQIYWEMTNGSSTQAETFEALGWADSIGSTPPIAADMCKVSALIFRQDDQAGVLPSRLQSDAVKAYAEIQGTYFQAASGKHFDTARQKAYYDDSGEAYWLLPQGSSVKFFIKQLNINATVTIPAQSTADLNGLLNP